MSKDKSKDKHCDYNNFKRARYFHGMLMTDRDFREEQIYHMEKRKLLNRMLHGWGVICGLGIKAACPASSKVIIKPGMALDPQGNEIFVCDDFEVDLKMKSVICDDISEKDKDPCAQEGEDNGKKYKYFVAIKYHEVPTDPVSVYAPGGGCEEKVCDYSRMREGFCVELFKSPPCYPVLPKDGFVENLLECLNKDSSKELNCIEKKTKKFHESFCKEPFPCPPCSCGNEPYVVLGTIDCTKTGGKIETIEQDKISFSEGRRYVMTFMFWQYYLGFFSPQIAEFLENPFTSICDLLADTMKLQKLYDSGKRKVENLYTRERQKIKEELLKQTRQQRKEKPSLDKKDARQK